MERVRTWDEYGWRYTSAVELMSKKGAGKTASRRQIKIPVLRKLIFWWIEAENKHIHSAASLLLMNIHLAVSIVLL